MARGRFVVLEGAEGTGKSTQAARLAARLDGLGVSVVATREPGGTGVGEQIREILLHRRDLAIEPRTELLLILAARAAFVRERVEPALAAGTWVVSDRFDLSTFAYQGHGRGLDLDRVRELNAYATEGLAPDLYLVLDLPVEQGRERQASEGKGRDRIEAEGLDFLNRVREGYVALARETESAELIPAGGTEDEVEARIVDVLKARFPETFGHRRV